MRKIIFCFIVMLSLNSLLAQKNKSFDEEYPSLWLKGVETYASSDFNSSYYQFNFNNVFTPLRIEDFNYSDILKSKFSVFAVLKSDLEDEVSVLSIKVNTSKTFISNKQVVNEKNNIYKKVDIKQGMILTYIASIEEKGRKKSSISLESISRPSTENGYRNDLLELLCFPRIVTTLEKQRIETYLSIKHGISLLGDVDYVNSKGDIIWNFKENKPFSKRVTGVGKDSFFNLDQKQSGNAQKDGLYIGLGTIQKENILNTINLTNYFFLLWGDNDQELKFQKNKKESSAVKKMKRVWKMQATNVKEIEPLATQVMIDKALFLVGDKKNDDLKKEDDVLWLLIDRAGGTEFDYQHAEYIMQSKDEKGKIFFDNVVWDTDKSGSDTFTFIKAPDFFMDYTIIEMGCSEETNDATLYIIGGKAPFQLSIAGPSKISNQVLEERSLFLADLNSGTYPINVIDQMGRRQSDTLSINSLKNVSVSVASQFYLGTSGKVVVVPTIENPDQQKLFYNWKRGVEVVSTEREFTTDKAGNYSFVVSNELGCQSEYSFKVFSPDSFINGWMLYPNPAKPDEEFSIKFNLEKESHVSLSFFDMSNRLLKTTELGMIKETQHTDSFSSIGTYLLVLSINGKTESTKIIIR